MQNSPRYQKTKKYKKCELRYEQRQKQKNYSQNITTQTIFDYAIRTVHKFDFKNTKLTDHASNLGKV